MSFRCCEKDFAKHRTSDDGNPTITYAEQAKVEDMIDNCYRYFRNLLDIETDIPELQRLRHETFLVKGLQHLSESYECLDASRPWLCYWILHSMELLGIDVSQEMGSKVADFLGRCQCPVEGGFAGGPGQQAHLAPTYAAVSALCIIGTPEAYQVINREMLLKFLMSRRTQEGAFTMHHGGEVDIRGAYCALSVARLTNIVCPEMVDGTAEWIVRCQTYEGGFAGCPGMEAHGGYSFCGLAALIFMNKQTLCDMKALLRWTSMRQMSYEGGFQGRTNKLVDGCYSFWQGGAFPLIHMALTQEGNNALSAEGWMFHQGALQEYVLICCQHPAGGLVDKPSKPRDYYHTCYCLSGLSVAQHFSEGRLAHDNIIGHKDKEIIGHKDTELKMTHPLFNISPEGVHSAHLHFGHMSSSFSTDDK